MDSVRSVINVRDEIDSKLCQALNELDSAMSKKVPDMTIAEAFIIGKSIYSAMESVKRARRFMFKD